MYKIKRPGFWKMLQVVNHYCWETHAFRNEVTVSKIRKNIHRSDAHVTFDFHSNFIYMYLQVLYSI